MRQFLTLAALLCVCIASAQDFTDADRYGLSNGKVVALGYDKWVKQYAKSSGLGAEGDGQATNIYSMALYDVSRTLLKDKSEADRQFHEDAAILFANIAKSAFTMADALYPNWKDLSLAVKQTGYKSNLARYRMLTEPTARTYLSKTDALREYRIGLPIAQSGGVNNSDYPKRQYGSLKFFIDRVDQLVAARSRTEQELAWEFVVEMIQLVSVKK